MEDICPICCSRDVDDMRHVTVECFYAVDEVAPEATTEKFLQEISDDAVIFGITRRYPAGEVDRYEVDSVTGDDIKTVSYRLEHDPIPPIRVREVNGYRLNCCKACRADFLDMFGRWSRGEMVGNRRPRPDQDIPVRINGQIRYMNSEEYEQWRIDNSAR